MSTSIQGMSLSNLSLYAITRVDVSHNNLLTLPSQLFGLKSLRLLNASHNRISDLCSATCHSRDSLQSSTDSLKDMETSASSSVFVDKVTHAVHKLNGTTHFSGKAKGKKVI